MVLKGAGSYSQMMMTTDDVNRPKEREEKDDTDKIMAFQSLERHRGVGVRYCFEFEAKDVGDTQGPTLFVRQCCMMMRIGIRLCERDQEPEFTLSTSLRLSLKKKRTLWKWNMTREIQILSECEEELRS
jgi:hypothetical protein